MCWHNKVMLLAVSVALHVEAAYVITQSGRKIEGRAISSEATGAVTLKMEGGQSMTFRKGQYREAVADKPEKLVVAETFLAEEKGEQAIELLQQVMREYRFLNWDQTAALLLGNYWYENGQFDEAVTAFNTLKPPLTSVVLHRRRLALLETGRLELVLPVLEKDIAEGSREAAANAYLMRGDLKANQGDVEGARRDWMKVSIFFKSQKDAAKQAEEKLEQSFNGRG